MVANSLWQSAQRGGIVIFNSWENIGDIAKELRKHDCEPKDVIRLIKKNPMPRNRDRRFIVDYEFAVWAVKNGDKWTFNRIDEKFERPEILCSVTPKSEKSFGNHPTQKPLYSMEWLINRLSNENDIVLDCFMGSGTTGVACLNTNRRFIGIELDENYYNIAKQRIENRESELKVAWYFEKNQKATREHIDNIQTQAWYRKVRKDKSRLENRVANV